MKVSIITACMNGASTIQKSIDSLVAQDYPNIEHILQDGGSSDNSVEIVQRISPSSLIHQSKDKGLYDALNKAMNSATGEIIGILHADDFYYGNEVISKVVKLFENTGCDAVYGDLKYVDRDQPELVKRTWVSGRYQKGDFLKGWMPPHPTVFVRKSVVEKLGGYNLEFNTAADYEWLLRIIHRHEIHIEYLPEFLVGMRVGGQSNVSLKSRLLANLEDRKAWKVNDLKPRWYTLSMKPLRKLKQFI